MAVRYKLHIELVVLILLVRMYIFYWLFCLSQYVCTYLVSLYLGIFVPWISAVTSRLTVSTVCLAKMTTFDLVYCEDIEKMMDNSPQPFCLWVTNHVSTFCGTKKCYIDGEMQQLHYAPAAWYYNCRRTHVISCISHTRRGRSCLIRTFCNLPRNLPIWKRIQTFDAPSWHLWEEKGRCNSRMIKCYQKPSWGYQ